MRTPTFRDDMGYRWFLVYEDGRARVARFHWWHRFLPSVIGGLTLHWKELRQ
jgi:hypothetical protein